MKTFTRCVLSGFTAAAAPALAQETKSGKLNQRYWVQLGAYHPSVDSRAQVDHPQTGAAGTFIDFETRSAWPLSGDVVFDDTTYNASASLASEFDSKVYRLSAGYSLYKTPEAEAGF